MFRFVLIVLALIAGAAPAAAQRYERPHADLATVEQPMRRVPTTGYTLALSWSPERCHGAGAASRGGRPAARRASAPECRAATRRGFTLHGLWPDGDGPNRWPQYCRPVAILTDAEIGAGIGATPSAQLMQHEWAKHGSCMSDGAAAYFGESGRLFRQVRYPDMAALAVRRGLTAARVQSAFAAANPGMRPAMLRLNVNKRGWLEEVWLCLGLDRRPRNCPAEQGGARPGDRVRIQAPV